MKKILLLMVAVVAAATIGTAKAQESNAIGLRLGYGLEVSYQRMLSDDYRIEVDLGFPGFDFHGVGATGTFLWNWDIAAVDGLGWYVGPGVNLGIWRRSFGLGVVGQIGIEYKFKAPITLSLDYRPGVNVVPGFGFSYTSFALGARYRF